MPLGRRRKSARRASSPAVASRCDGTSEDNHVPDRAVSPPPLAEVMVKRNLLATCVTCLLCKGLLSDATTIPECLHTFCRKCILKKLVDEEEECCPVCKTHLGSSPVDKLRADHHLQYIREKIFPLKRKRIVATDSNPNPDPDPNSTPIPNSNSNPNPLPQIQVQVQKVKKERSLSSLVTENTKRPKASRMPVSLTKSKSKDKLSHFTNGSAQKKAKTIEQKQEKETSPPVLMTYARRQINSDPEGSNSHTPRQHSETKGPIRNKPESEVSKCKVKSETENIEGDDERKNGENTQKIAKRNNINGTRKRSKVVGQSLIGTQPVWFSLVASSHPEGGMDLPQLPANYLRIKDDTMKVSSLEKYIKNKLGLSDETEVEIMCRGQCIDPETTLQSLINMWIRNESSNKVKTLVGSSAKDFIMVLMYHLKSQAPLMSN